MYGYQDPVSMGKERTETDKRGLLSVSAAVVLGIGGVSDGKSLCIVRNTHGSNLERQSIAFSLTLRSALYRALLAVVFPALVNRQWELDDHIILDVASKCDLCV